jgi:hypothetical protein
MAGGRKRQRSTAIPRDGVTWLIGLGHEVDHDSATDDYVASIHPSDQQFDCGTGLVQVIWEQLSSHTLSPQRTREFRASPDAILLASMSTGQVRVAARKAIEENPNGHLLLAEWRHIAEKSPQ